MTPPPPARAARPAELAAAARRLFDHLPDADAAGRAERLEAHLRSGSIDPAGLLVSADAGGVSGATLVHITLGNAASSWPPHARPGPDRAAVLASLAAAHRDRLAACGVRVAQVTLAPGEAETAAPLEAVGFVRTTSIVALARPAALAFGPDAGRGEWRITPATDADPAVGELLLASYIGSLDCPELNDARPAADILAGYAGLAAERGGECRWHLLERGGAAVGVLLVGPGTVAGIEEIAYLGLTPSARGRGGGPAAVRRAVRDALGRGAEWVITSMDERNAPARRLYERLGFRAFDEQVVWLWRGGGPE